MKAVSRQWSVASFILCVMLFALWPLARAQQPEKIRRIGYRHAFRRGLSELGYEEGKDIVIEWRSGERSRERQRRLAAELVRLKVSVIVAGGSGDIRAAKEATATIPIVMVNSGDAVGSGFVASLARPGGNITGLATLRPELMGKRLEIVKEIVPKLSRLAVFLSPSSGDRTQILNEIEVAADALRVKLQRFDITSLKDFETAFQAAAKERFDAVLVRVAGPILSPYRKAVAQLAVKSRLPAIYEDAQEVEAGGLLSYGVNDLDLYRRAATYVDKILKGAKPADLPVEQPTKFELVINLKAAKQIGITIPPNVLARADKVIR
jgi:putative ABC transport system substrate-binding protein